MAQKWLLILSLSGLLFYSCEENKTDNKTIDKFDVFIQKDKFVEDTTMFYPGLIDTTLRPLLTAKINQAAEDFREVALSPSPTEQEYLEKMKTGLRRFEGTPVMYETEEKERVCLYFMELMDIVGLKSSQGILNTFLYGFDPDTIKNDIPK